MRKTSHKRNLECTPCNGKPIAQSVSPEESYALAGMPSQWLYGIFLAIMHMHALWGMRKEELRKREDAFFMQKTALSCKRAV
ncbi:MAG: hypothetical protein IJD65_02565 [Mailhella sp.]|nr:hypothetical protein [Mailhella sp.]